MMCLLLLRGLFKVNALRSSAEFEWNGAVSQVDAPKTCLNWSCNGKPSQLSVPPDYHDHKAPRLGRRTTGGSRLLFLKFERRQIRFMSRRVNIHSFGANRGGHSLDYLELAGRIFSHNAQLAIAAARECLLTVELRGIHAGPYRKIGDHLAVVRAHHNHLLRLAASHEEPVLRDIDRQSHRRPAG